MCHLCGRRTKQASNLRSHYKHIHSNTEITGQKIRHNARVFARFSQEQLEEQLRQCGDLVSLLVKGLEDYETEENARQLAEKEQFEQALLSTPAKTKLPEPRRPLPYISPKPERVKPEVSGRYFKIIFLALILTDNDYKVVG